jgi:D-3-phosphoglycerate dehydrogenase
MRVLVSDKFPSEGLQVLEQAEGIELDYQPGLTTEQLLGAVAEADALIVRSGTAITEEIFQAANRLKVVGRAGVGTRNLDLEAANRKGVVVMHTPFGSTTTTAEHTIAMIFALARQIPAASQSTKKGSLTAFSASRSQEKHSAFWAQERLAEWLLSEPFP